MKRSVLILFLVCVLLIGVMAQGDLDESLDSGVEGLSNIDSETGLPYEIEKIKDIGEKLGDEELRKEFLKKSWGKVEDSGIVGFIYKLSYFDPFFEFALGMKFDLSFLFILHLVFWFFILVFLFRIMEVFSLFSTWFRALVSVVANFLASWFGVVPWLTGLIISAVSKMGDWKLQLIGWVIVVIGMIVAIYFSKAISNLAKQWREGYEKESEKVDRRRLRQGADVAGAFVKGVRG